MAESEKTTGYIELFKDILGNISKIIAASVFSPLEQGTQIIMKQIEIRIMRMVKRFIWKISVLIILGIGGIFLTIAFIDFLIEYLNWNRALAYLCAGILILVIGLSLKVGESR